MQHVTGTPRLLFNIFPQLGLFPRGCWDRPMGHPEDEEPNVLQVLSSFSSKPDLPSLDARVPLGRAQRNSLLGLFPKRDHQTYRSELEEPRRIREETEAQFSQSHSPRVLHEFPCLHRLPKLICVERHGTLTCLPARQ